MNAASPYRLAPGVALRSEPFGALVYHYDSRKLHVIQSREAADFIAGLDGVCSLDAAVAEFVSRHALPPAAADALLRTIERLENTGIVCAVAPA